LVGCSLVGCTSEIEGPAPVVASDVAPSVACNGQSAENADLVTRVRLTSPDSSFSALPVDVLGDSTLVLPEVYLIAPDGAELRVEEVQFESQRSLVAMIDADMALATGSYRFVVVNPDGQRSEVAGTLEIVDPPTVTAIEASSAVMVDDAAQICPTIDNVLTLTGTGFRPGDAPPTVAILTCPTGPGSCELVTRLQDVTVASETRLSGTVPSEDQLEPGVYSVRVINPERPPCVATLTDALIVVPPPEITSIVPDLMCGPDDELTTEVRIRGANFQGAMSASIGTEELSDVTVVDSETLSGTYANALEPGTYDVTVTLAEGCSATLPDAVTIVPAPTLTSVAPTEACSGATITLTGTDFGDDLSAWLGGEPLADLTVVDETTATATVPSSLVDGQYDLTVESSLGCSSTLIDAVTVYQFNGVIDSMLPSAGYNAIDTPVIIYGSGFAAGDSLYLVGAGQGGADLLLIDVVVDPSGTRIEAAVPQGGVPGGPYDLVLANAHGCSAELLQAFTITDVAEIDLTSIVPEFGWTGARTPVSIFGDGFESTPSAYLVVPTMSPTLQKLSNTGFINTTSLTSVVPAGLDVGGPYDLVVINPDGGAGVLPAAFRVTQQPPPTIDNISPGAADFQTDTLVTLTGCNFRDPATVELIDPTAATFDATGESVPDCSGAATCPDGSNVCTMTATFPTSTLSVGPYVVRVTNTDEGTFGDYSLFVVTEPSGKLSPWATSGATLETGRRSHAGVAGRIDNASRYLYVIGGDTGAGGAALDSVEVVPLDIFGDLGTPFEQRYTLSSPRTGLAAVQKGGYLYAIGGSSDLTTPLATVERARILTADDVPEPTASVVAGSLDAGAWYYKVSAVMSSSDPDNPDGETLPSDEVVISLGIAGGVQLDWTAVPGAVAYRIYRSEAVDGQSTTEVYLDETTATTYVDAGAVTPDPSRTPLARGSTGVWVVQTETLTRARLSHGATIAHDPTGAAFVYAAAGIGMCDGLGVDRPMDCYEYAPLSADGATLGAWTNVEDGLDTPRFRCGVGSGESSNSSQIPADEAYVFLTGGEGIGGGTDSDGEALQVLTGGALGAPQLLQPNTSAKMDVRGGHAFQLVNNALYAIGGESAGVPLASTNFSVDFTTVPFRSSFSNSSVSMASARWEHVVILESGFFYAIGGSTDAALSNAADSIEFTIY
jgi:hypothetical protein